MINTITLMCTDNNFKDSVITFIHETTNTINKKFNAKSVYINDMRDDKGSFIVDVSTADDESAIALIEILFSIVGGDNNELKSSNPIIILTEVSQEVKLSYMEGKTYLLNKKLDVVMSALNRTFDRINILEESVASHAALYQSNGLTSYQDTMSQILDGLGREGIIHDVEQTKSKLFPTYQ